MMRWSGGNEGQTESVVAGGRTPLQGVCRRHRGWRVRVTTQCGIASAALVIVLSGNACPMIDSVAQSNVRGVAHDYDMRLAAAFRHGRYARQCPERLIVTAAKRPGSLGK